MLTVILVLATTHLARPVMTYRHRCFNLQFLFVSRMNHLIELLFKSPKVLKSVIVVRSRHEDVLSPWQTFDAVKTHIVKCQSFWVPLFTDRVE